MKKILQTYLDKRMLFIFLNGIASGFPWVIIGSAMTLWLKDEGLSRTAIGFFGSIFTVYSINWIWAPFLDRVKLPILLRFGQRRSWLLLLQGLLLILIIALSFTNPKDNLVWLSLLAVSIAIVSATQDIVIDAYRIDIMHEDEKDKLPAAASMATAGWWVGYGFLGAIALYLSDFGNDWPSIYLIISSFVILFIFNTLWLFEPDSIRAATQEQTQQRYQGELGVNKITAWLLTTVFEPIKDFFTRFGKVAIALLLFIIFFKIGEAFLGRMSLVFYKEIGFSNGEIATYSKLVGSFLTVFFSLVASAITIHYGLVRGLMISGIAMASTNLIFAYMAYIGPNTTVFATAILLDNFTAAFSTVAFVAFISHLTNRAYTATQYAIMASAGNFGRTVFASSSGLLIDGLGGNWMLFFIITALMVIPSLIILYWIGKKLKYIF